MTALRSEECRIFAEYGWNRGTEFFSFIPVTGMKLFIFEGAANRTLQACLFD